MRALGDAIIQALEDVGLLVGDAQTPLGAKWQGEPGQSDFQTYCIVYPTGGGWSDGSVGKPHDDLASVFQVTCVGSTRAGAEEVRSLVRTTLLSNPMKDAISGTRVISANLDVPIAAVRDDDVQPPLFFTADRFRFITSPTSN